MKPQIIIPVSLLMLAFILCSNTVYGSNKTHKKSKTEQTEFNMKDIKPVHDYSNNIPGNNQPSRPQKKENDRDSIPPKEASHRRSHSDEDGKHHHFHMHRAKKVKRCSGLVCLLAKILLVITHICLLISVYYATFMHASH